MVSKTLRRKVLRKKGCYCHGCGWEPKDKKSRIVIHIHHMDGDDNNDDMDNLVPLCSDCHSFIHSTRKTGVSIDYEDIDDIVDGDKTMETSNLIQKENKLLLKENELDERERELENIEGFVKTVGDKESLIDENNNLFHLLPPCGSKDRFDYERTDVKTAILRDYGPCKVCFGRLLET